MAEKAVNAYEQAANNEMLDMRELERQLGDLGSDVPPTPTTSPEVIEVKLKSKDVNQITIEAIAKSEDGSSLTYTLKAGTEKGNLDKVSSQVIGESGQSVDITVSELLEYTDYYYEVEVKDTSNNIDKKEGNGTVKTMCSGKTIQCQRTYCGRWNRTL